VKIFVTGGTGFVGNNIVVKLLERRYEAVLFIRDKNSTKKLGTFASRLNFVYGNVQDINSIERGMSGCDAVIHLVGIIREVGSNTFDSVHYEGTKNVIEAAKSSNIKRFIHMSAEGTSSAAKSKYHNTKFRAEEYLKSSGLNYTIFRPSMLFGPKDKNFNILADLIRKGPFIPVIGDGNYRWQPVSVKDVAEVFVSALENQRAEGKVYEIRGPDIFTFNEVLDILMKILSIKRTKVHIPVALIRPIVYIIDRILSSPPITTDQLKMLLDNYDHPIDDLLEDFRIELTPFDKGLREYILKGG
jgi:nucleoside-diphosphate-sugar epimerase